MCNEFVQGEDNSWYHTVLTGEMAHNIGATTGKKSPRRSSQHVGDREALENLLLLCHDCHRIIDNPAHEDQYTTEVLRDIKNRHEQRIALMTQGAGLTRTAVMRVGANIRGTYAMADRHDVGEVLIRENYLPLVESRVHGDFECRISGDEGDPYYWDMARGQVAKTVDLVMQAVSSEDIKHISVFGFAPIPVLVHLGALLDDKIPARIFQRNPSTGAWGWPENGNSTDFDHAHTPGATSDIVLEVGLSAPIDPSRLPAELGEATRLTLSPVSAPPGRNVLTDEDALLKFGEAFSAMLAHAEDVGATAARWHLVAAVPLSAAIVMGRAFMRTAHPPVAVYQRTDTAYVHALDTNT